MSKKKQQIPGWMYDIIRRPVITEKSMLGSEHGKVTFSVPVNAQKPAIKKAVETIYEVKVTGINTLRQQGKRKRFRRVEGQRNETKKAVVTLAESHNIDVTSGV